MSKAASDDLDLANPGLRKTIVKQYEKYGENFIKEEYGVSRQRLDKWKRLKEETGSFAPRYAERGKKSLLTPKEIQKIETELERNPAATNQELAKVVKNKVSAREVGKIIAKSPKQFTWKLEQADVEETFSPAIYNEGRQFIREIRNIPYDDRVYMDETFASSGIRRRKVRVPKGKIPWVERNRKYKRMVIMGAITKNGWLRPSKFYNKGSITDDDFETYVKNDLAPYLRPGQVVFWDQYGRFGRVKNPKSRHFSVKARKYIEARGARLKILPRYGKLLDPIEMIFGDTKKIYEKKLEKFSRSMRLSEIDFKTKKKLWLQSENEVSPKSFTRAFKERASGQEFFRVSKEKDIEE